jgi:hypothetical protein
MGDVAPSAVCPQCHRADDVRTVAELFDLLNAVQGGAAKQAETLAHAPPPATPTRGPTRADPYVGPDQQLFNDLVGIAGGLVGRAVGKRVRRTYDERVVPTLEAAAHQQQQQALNDQAAIVDRYPELRGCLQDQVLFLAGGSRVVPIADVTMPITLAEADALVARLRG